MTNEEEYDDFDGDCFEPVGSCEECGTNLYEDDDPELCDQCLWRSIGGDDPEEKSDEGDVSDV